MAAIVIFIILSHVLAYPDDTFALLKDIGYESDNIES